MAIEKFNAILNGEIMTKYYYCVNTFRNDKPIQIAGCIEAENAMDVIQKLISNGNVDPHGYEFLDLYPI